MSAQPLVDLEDLYRAAVGPQRADYYAAKFLRFDRPGASRISWNWPAFIPLVSFFWFLYRRMYGYWAVFCLLIPLAMTFCIGIAAAFFRAPHVMFIVDIAALAYPYIVVPMIANALYHRHIKRRIETLHGRVPDPAVQVTVLENAPHTSPIACVLLAIAAVPLIGIMAAIAIPAYQMYSVRAQVAQGLMLAKPLERAVAEQFRRQHRWPAELADLGVSHTPFGQYLATISLDHGTLSITYGNRASRVISGHVLSLRPTILAGRIAWTCGYANVEGDDPGTGAAAPSRTDIDARDLPSACRGGERLPSAAVASPARPPETSVVHAEAASEPSAVGSAPNIPLDIADSIAVTQQVSRMRRQEVQQQIQSDGRPSPPIFGRCTAKIRIDDAGLPATDFPIACSDPRVADILRRAISTAGTPHAPSGSTVLLRVTALFPPS
jgi:type IV pilus assembly protein PilA